MLLCDQYELDEHRCAYAVSNPLRITVTDTDPFTGARGQSASSDDLSTPRCAGRRYVTSTGLTLLAPPGGPTYMLVPRARCFRRAARVRLLSAACVTFWFTVRTREE